MRLAVISDIHANIVALEAVLKECGARGVEGILSLGDLVGHGPRPNEVVARVKAHGISGIAGNYDLAVCHVDAARGAAEYLKSPISEAAMQTYLWTREKTSLESLEYLAGLPASLCIDEGEISFQFVHGSPAAPNEYLYPQGGEERLEKLLSDANVDVLVAGHTHLPMARRVGERLVLNPGSVGRPKDGDPRASFIVLDTENGLRVEHIRVIFDVESVVKDCVISGLPKEQAQNLRLGLS